MIRNNVPNSIEINAQYISNLRQRAAIHHATNPNVNENSSKDAQKVIAPGHISLTEAESFEEPLFRSNFNDSFRSIMHNDTSTWKAVAFLQKFEKELPDFQYKVHFGPDGFPDAIMSTTAVMRKNLICYGHMMLLDAQMRAFS